MFYSGRMMKPKASAALVLPYLEWLHARGRELLLRPVTDYVQLIALQQDHVNWWCLSNKALRRAFDDGELFERFASPCDAPRTFQRGVDTELAGFRSWLEAEMRVLEVAIAAARVRQP
jgi:hypothetical protein